MTTTPPWPVVNIFGGENEKQPMSPKVPRDLLLIFDMNASAASSIKKIQYSSQTFLISSILIVLVTFSYLFNTGCLIYPVSFTCFEALDWSINKSEVIASNNWFELWSKAGATPNYIIENREIYTQDFNWLGIWINEYFFTKVSDFVIGIFVLCLVVYFLFYPIMEIRLLGQLRSGKIFLIQLRHRIKRLIT